MIASARVAIRDHSPPRWKRRFSYLQDALLVCVSALFFYVHVRHAVEEASITSVFFGIEQGLLVGMFLTRRRTGTTSQRPFDWFIATVGGWLSLAMRPHETGGMFGVIGPSIQVVGLGLVIVCFASIGKSFGVVAANRGLKVHGPYRLLRHPIYFSHTVTLIGFTIANVWWPNLAILLVVTAFQVLRIQSEERVLSATSNYEAYSARVRWRLFPGVF